MIDRVKHGEDGWLEWATVAPALRDCPVILARNDWTKTIVMRPDEVAPETNIANLFWKPTGIYREVRDSMPEDVYSQCRYTTSWLQKALGLTDGSILELGSSRGNSL